MSSLDPPGTVIAEGKMGEIYSSCEEMWGARPPGSGVEDLEHFCLSSPLQFVAKRIHEVVAIATHQNPRVVIQHQGCV